MPVIEYNKEQLTDIVESFNRDIKSLEEIDANMRTAMDDIREVWTGSDDQISGRESDFRNILDNLSSITAKIRHNYNVLQNKNDAFAQVFYEKK